MNFILLGAVHTEELQYLWNMTGINTGGFNPGTIENEFMNNMVIYQNTGYVS